MISVNEPDIDQLLRQLYDDNDNIRIKAINKLGDIGDELCLKDLRERLRLVNEEHMALIVAVGKLKRKLGVK